MTDIRRIQKDSAGSHVLKTANSVLEGIFQT